MPNGVDIDAHRMAGSRHKTYGLTVFICSSVFGAPRC